MSILDLSTDVTLLNLVQFMKHDNFIILKSI